MRRCGFGHVVFLGALALSLVCAGSSLGATAPKYNPGTDPYSMYNVTADVGATSWWKAGYTGKGVDVALIDSGVSPVGALSGAGKVVYGPDLSLESQNPALHNLDTFGHGTFMAGLIAGHDVTLKAPYGSAAATSYRGVAPDARIVSLKVGDADGGVDVTQVIAAVDWVVQHAHDPGFNIRVINLSYGTNSLQDPSVDPLAFAVEQAWLHGIVVVAAAGNTGFQLNHGATGLADPANDPFVIAAGGADTMGSAAGGDDVVGDYSASAAACSISCRAPDFVAPGSHLQGLRVPGSYLDLAFPEGRLGTTYFRGSGTSEAAAMTSGAIALILQKYPSMTPDQVKAFLAASAVHVNNTSNKLQGAGEIDLGSMVSATPPTKYAQGFMPSTGLGTIEASRGTDHIALNDIPLTGEQDIFGTPLNTALLALLESAGSSWSGGMWNGNSWSGSSWSGNSWSGSTWSGSSWSGNTWSGSSWSGKGWSGNSWSGSTWSGNSWSGGSWQGATWR